MDETTKHKHTGMMVGYEETVDRLLKLSDELVARAMEAVSLNESVGERAPHNSPSSTSPCHRSAASASNEASSTIDPATARIHEAVKFAQKLLEDRMAQTVGLAAGQEHELDRRAPNAKSLERRALINDAMRHTLADPKLSTPEARIKAAVERAQDGFVKEVHALTGATIDETPVPVSPEGRINAVVAIAIESFAQRMDKVLGGKRY